MLHQNGDLARKKAIVKIDFKLIMIIISKSINHLSRLGNSNILLKTYALSFFKSVASVLSV